MELVDGQETDQKVSMVIAVTVRDRNDLPPTFTESSYEVTIDEGLPRGTQVPNFNMVVSDGDLVSGDVELC